MVQYIDSTGLDLSDKEDHFGIIKEHIGSNKSKYPVTENLIRKAECAYIGGYGKEPDARLKVYKVRNRTDMLVILDFLRNKTVLDLIGGKDKKTRLNWIFIDPTDILLEESASADYLSEYMYKSNLMQTVITLVLQDSIKLINSPMSIMAFEDVIRSSGYFKLLNQGPVERHKYIDLLAIPQALVPIIFTVGRNLAAFLTASVKGGGAQPVNPA